MGLGTPGYLLRRPYGELFRPAEQFPFNEFTGKAGFQGYLWGNGGVACACVTVLGFIRNGWDFKPGVVLELAGMPLHVYRDEDDE